MSTSWQPGDPLYTAPPEGPPGPGESAELRPGGGRPMHWRSDRAVPGPWPWLQPGPAPIRPEVAA